MNHRWRIWSLLAGLAWTGAAGAAGNETGAPEARWFREHIRPEALGAHVRFLADDLFEGRGTGTRGYDLAARYVASRFEAIGLEPAGSEGWYQPVPLRSARVLPDRCGLTVLRGAARAELVLGQDFHMGADVQYPETDVTAAVVFVGYGVTAPDLGHDDFAGIDVRGKIVAVLSGAPPTFAPTLRAHYSNGRVKDANLAAHGAIGQITLRTLADERRSPWERGVRQSQLPAMRWIGAQGALDGVQPGLRTAATLHRRGAEVLFQGAPVPLAQVLEQAEAGSPAGFALPVRVRLRRASSHESVHSPNVAGLLRGSDPGLQEEVVVVTAHLDHLGVGVPVRGDSIHNGAYDNATGCAALIEMAHAFAARRERPRRSVLFLAVTGEEKGLQGASYFNARPSLPPGLTTIANVNLDMYVMVAPLRELVAHGAAHSTLAEPVERAARDLGLPLVADPAPEEVVFVRSDQYMFVRAGIPSLFIVGGPGAGGVDRLKAWRQNIYHTPQDDLSQPLDLESLAAWARVNGLTAWWVAQGASRPRWNEGDFFGRTFGGGRPARPAR